MSGSSERKRSQTKYLQDSARMAALVERQQLLHSADDYKLYSELHTRAVITAYGNLIQLGHQVHEIDPAGQLKDDVYDILKHDYDEDYYWVAWLCKTPSNRLRQLRILDLYRGFSIIQQSY
eukprot:SAG11_NODE_629_length_8073_cov_6.782042_4_plen_121_part_00